ncbi:unnamed protein product [Parascedosporium putredinis]|uniref:Uncharacterized protein n=1 Tax=Parascedosporium putredinis TaxID=1442378 RepID=A0A9P1H548_9PEZI|nr:unnamed protein product [Parascedosporium putredinis]CAI7996077.1 unnamed protein product [Parascedosporium putredinis]
MNYAIRSGITLASTYAISQCTRLATTVSDKRLGAELSALQGLLDRKLQIISPAIDLIEFKSGRGNVFLESAVSLARSLRQDVVALGKRLEGIALPQERLSDERPGVNALEGHEEVLRSILHDLRDLLSRIDHDIPYYNWL